MAWLAFIPLSGWRGERWHCPVLKAVSCHAYYTGHSYQVHSYHLSGQNYLESLLLLRELVKVPTPLDHLDMVASSAPLIPSLKPCFSSGYCILHLSKSILRVALTSVCAGPPLVWRTSQSLLSVGMIPELVSPLKSIKGGVSWTNVSWSVQWEASKKSFTTLRRQLP